MPCVTPRQRARRVAAKSTEGNIVGIIYCGHGPRTCYCDVDSSECLLSQNQATMTELRDKYKESKTSVRCERDDHGMSVLIFYYPATSTEKDAVRTLFATVKAQFKTTRRSTEKKCTPHSFGVVEYGDV